MLQSMELPRVGHDWATELNSQKRKKKKPQKERKRIICTTTLIKIKE